MRRLPIQVGIVTGPTGAGKQRPKNSHVSGDGVGYGGGSTFFRETARDLGAGIGKGAAMAIVFHCKCGHLLRAQVDAAGKRTKCPACNQVLTIPPPARTASAPASASAPAAVEEPDPFLTELDWSSLESQTPPTDDHSRPGSGIIKVDAAHTDAPVVEAAQPGDGSRQYRVLAQKDQGFAGKFNAAKLEEVLNDHARRGWSLKAAVTLNIPSHGGNHDELVVILER